jgi:pimeloyl-ACP methyl ester carboxylesterase
MPLRLIAADLLRSAGRPDKALKLLEQGLARAPASSTFLTSVGVLLDERRAAGKVRRCHGDLHLRNICLVDGRPVLFDCVEFSEELASIDVLYDLAFLLMDLDHRGHRDLANLVLNRYLDLTGEDEGITLMPLFLALRAVIRAHVTATMAEHGWGSGDNRDAAAAFADARRYLDEAEVALVPIPARLVAVGGLSGAGKSVLAAGLASELGRRPGGRVLRSDVLRKLRFGAEPGDVLEVRIRTIKLPTLLLTESETASPQLKLAINALQTSLPNPTLVVLEGQQHNAMDTVPQRFAEVVESFLLGKSSTKQQ